jgi:hypothetical protein
MALASKYQAITIGVLLTDKSSDVLSGMLVTRQSMQTNRLLQSRKHSSDCEEDSAVPTGANSPGRDLSVGLDDWPGTCT